MSFLKVVEAIPLTFTRRDGDWSQEGGNNTLIVMGTDRASPGPATVDAGLGTVEADGGGRGAGTIQLVAGRRVSDPDFSSDDAFLYLSQKTRVDDNLGLSANGATNSVPAAVLKSAAVRFIARQNIRITLDDEGSYIFVDADQVEIRLGSTSMKVSDGKVVIDAGTIELGPGASERVMLGDTFLQLYNAHSHPTAVGPTGLPLVQLAPVQVLSQQVAKVK